jgi:hypothetical protein
MPEYIFLKYDDPNGDETAWEPYLRRLKQSGCFQGGSAIGAGNPLYEAGGTVEIRELPRTD